MASSGVAKGRESYTAGMPAEAASPGRSIRAATPYDGSAGPHPLGRRESELGAMPLPEAVHRDARGPQANAPLAGRLPTEID